jgi:hypothetical protein
METIALVSAEGRLLRLAAPDWAEALHAAIANGWKPAGSSPPPRRWGLESGGEPAAAWDGRYVEAAGQCVTARDALAFAEALARAGGGEGPAAVAVFCARGSFLVCRMSAELAAAEARMQTGLQRLGERLGLEAEEAAVARAGPRFERAAPRR